MDPLQQEDGQMAALEELFEFIDCCMSPNDYSNAHITLPCMENTTPAQDSPTTVDQVNSSRTGTTAPTKRKRTRTNWSSSTGLQRRKRAELQFLREHVRDLEAFADKLKQRADVVHVAQKDSSNWQELAAAEYQQRLRAEKTNRKLRKIQRQVSATLKILADINAFT